MDNYYDDYNYGVNYGYNYESNDFPRGGDMAISPIFEDIYEYLDTAYMISLGLLGGLVASQIGLLAYTLYKTTQRSKFLSNPEDPKIKIIRGVPGVGKRNYIYYLESGLNREFAICDWNDFFVKDGNYKFNGKETSKAENYCMRTLLAALTNNVKRIYIIGNFNEKWQYENYINIGKIFKYKIEISELVCKSIPELKHYNTRSTHDIPYNKSLKLYESWEDDPAAYKRTPYLNDASLAQFSNTIGALDNEILFEDTIGLSNVQILLPHLSTFDEPWTRDLSSISQLNIVAQNIRTVKEYSEINTDLMLNMDKQGYSCAETDDNYNGTSDSSANNETYVL